MFIGICILAVLCVVTVLQVWLMTKGSALGMRCGLLAFDAVLGVAATAYSGFLLTQAVGVPLWTTAAIPVLWIFSGLACAVGLIEILAAAGKLDAESPRWLHAAGWAVHGGEAFVLLLSFSRRFQVRRVRQQVQKASSRAAPVCFSGAVRSAAAF